MPFKSEAQRRFLYATNPEVAEKFSKHTKKGKKLPERVKSKAAAVEQGGRGVYLPEAKIKRLKSTKEGRKKLRAASRKKSKANREGRQYSRHGLAANTSLKKAASLMRKMADKKEKKKKVRNILSRLTGGDIALTSGIAGSGIGLATYDQLSKLDGLLKGHEKALRSKATGLGVAANKRAREASEMYNRTRGGLPRLLKWYAGRRGLPEKIDLTKRVPTNIIEREIPKLTMGGKAIRRTALKSGAKVTAGTALALLLGRSLSRKVEDSKRLKNLTQVLDAKEVKLASLGRNIK